MGELFDKNYHDVITFFGNEVMSDYPSYYWWQRAAAQGNQDAIAKLNKLGKSPDAYYADLKKKHIKKPL